MSSNEENSKKEEIPEILKNIPKDGEFLTPNNYFDYLSGNILSKISDDITLPESIKNIKKSNDFIVPENYFETLPQRIVAAKHKKENAHTKFSKYKKLSVAFVAASAVVLGLLLFFPKNNLKNNTDTELAVSSEDLINSLYLNEIELDVIANAIEGELHKNQHSDIEDYLIENDVDINILTGEL
jgi:hypothetical protein